MKTLKHLPSLILAVSAVTLLVIGILRSQNVAKVERFWTAARKELARSKDKGVSSADDPVPFNISASDRKIAQADNGQSRFSRVVASSDFQNALSREVDGRIDSIFSALKAKSGVEPTKLEDLRDELRNNFLLRQGVGVAQAGTNEADVANQRLLASEERLRAQLGPDGFASYQVALETERVTAFARDFKQFSATQPVGQLADYKIAQLAWQGLVQNSPDALRMAKLLLTQNEYNSLIAFSSAYFAIEEKRKLETNAVTSARQRVRAR